MDKKRIRNRIYLAGAFVCSLWYLPHLICYALSKKMIDSDVRAMLKGMDVRLPVAIGFLFLFHSNRYFRSLYYYRIGPAKALLIRWMRPGERTFIISNTTRLGQGVCLAHPFATILEAESIGKNFSFRHLATLGYKDGKKPVIGDNVSLGANVTIIGGVRVGDNVQIGANTLVIKDIPDNCVVAGYPARILRYLDKG